MTAADMSPIPDDLPDEFGPYLDQARQSPEFDAAYDDAHAAHALIDDLIELRKQAGLTQTEVARRMGVDQPAVQKFESRRKPPMLLTVQRYARAVGARLCATVCPPEPVDAEGGEPQ